MDYGFLAPHFAWLLPLWAGIAYWTWRRPGETSGIPAPRPPIAPHLAALLLIAALCRPYWGVENVQQESRGRDLLFALDVSRSMLADDLAPRRLHAAKAALRALLPALEGDRVGLLAFAGSAFLVCPLTGDLETFARALDETGPDSLPLGGSAFAPALEEAGRALKGGGQLVVLSDGEDHRGDFEFAARALRAAGVDVHAVVVGATSGALLRLEGGEFVRDRQGALVSSRARPDLLAALAAAGGGQYLDLAREPAALIRLHRETLARAPVRPQARERSLARERFAYPLGLALVFLGWPGRRR